jgi:hypothetical protein
MLLYAAHTPDTISIWTSLHTCVDNMGMEGVSEDEEVPGGTYRIKTVPWRNPDIADWMAFVDLRYWHVKGKSGSVCRARVRGGTSVSPQEPVLNLPPWYYNQAYAPLNTLTNSDSTFAISRIGLTNIEGLLDDQIEARRAGNL